MFDVCYSIISCCGFCPWAGYKIQAPNGAYVPVDISRGNKRIYLNAVGYLVDDRMRIYPKHATSLYSSTWRAVDNVDYSKFGFVVKNIPHLSLRGGGEFVWVHPESRFAQNMQKESGCLIL